ncbi:MAG: SpoIID/LytB domain-containing protein [Bacteroidales bacterium]|nr:SpoIID/LytB domain-containing protein [Bacteroidales bacterium]
MKKSLLIIICLLSLVVDASAERVRVRLFSNNSIDNIAISFDLGTYNIYADDTILIEPEVGIGKSIELTPVGQKVHVTIDGYNYGNHNTIHFTANDTACILCLNPRNLKHRTYEGDLHVSVNKNGKLFIINEVEFETYIAGVVQSEIYGDSPDIFRVQAIISRTWALKNINKHRSEGYNFCDQVHCQAYLNRCVRPDIMLGTMLSSGMTIVDNQGKLIDTPFHSNSGGQTANSEDVWRSAVPYLRSVNDTFSYHMRQSEWVKVINKDKWLNYFASKHKVDIHNDSIRNLLLSFSQSERKVRLCGVPLTRIRTDFQLKSTFFSIIYDSVTERLTLSGHGFGHGVGLSQEGAIRMVGLGISYDSIIHHYYTSAHIQKNDIYPSSYVEHYIQQISQIIEEDKQSNTQTKSKKDDWLGRLFRLRDREEREEVYDPTTEELENDWKYDW